MSKEDSCWEKPGIGQPLCPSPDRARLKRSTRRTRAAFLQQRRMFLRQSKRCCPVPIQSPRPPTPLPAFPFPATITAPVSPSPCTAPGLRQPFHLPVRAMAAGDIPIMALAKSCRCAPCHTPAAHQPWSRGFGDDAPPGLTHHPHLSGISPPCPPCDPQGWRG